MQTSGKCAVYVQSRRGGEPFIREDPTAEGEQGAAETRLQQTSEMWKPDLYRAPNTRSLDEFSKRESVGLQDQLVELSEGVKP